MVGNAHHGVHGTYAQLAESLRSYLEAQYHIRNEAAIQERRLLLEEAGSVCQAPYVESTPVYELGQEYKALNLPDPVRKCLSALAQIDVGIFKRPYVHQAKALESFFDNPSQDLIVATGTGSGKTESFLMPIIGELVMEAARSAKSAAMPGCRAILLYPMNALVNDQNSRIRRLIGNADASKIVSETRGRPVRFGTYTGRTPYPGIRSAAKDTVRIAPLFERYYLKLLRTPSKVSELEKIGQWPAKDMVRFYGADLEETIQTKKGPQRRRHWDKRLRTQASDRELMTRDETQVDCPDILITNYSMLEYMLVRPIERSIFNQTRDWLASDDRNQLVLVLDEAHMYRGAGGAEVALLLRRLVERLGVARERVRFILTSASLGDSEEARNSIVSFGQDLTGLSIQSPRKFKLITGEREHRSGQAVGDKLVGAALGQFDIEAFHNGASDPVAARGAVASLAKNLGWPALGEEDDLADYLFRVLTGFGPLELLIDLVSGKAIKLDQLQEQLFEDPETWSAATATLLAISSFAKRKGDGRVLLPTRLHMFFRGLPGLYACCDATCAHGRAGRRPDSLIGRLHTTGHDECSCGARTFELFTHRECGGAFLHGYIAGPHGDFVWSGPSGRLREGGQAPLVETDILIEGDPHPGQVESCVEAWLDVKTGRLFYQEPKPLDGFRKVYLPDPTADFGRNGLRFQDCPVCNDKAFRKGRSSIMDHVTKGEAPFANLVKTQLETQPATRQETREFPNGGRKVLLFSDGRQKAARLARDIPREVEQDIFRQVIVLATQRLREIKFEAKPTRNLYIAILTVLRDYNLPIFDRIDAQTIENHIEVLSKDFNDTDLAELTQEFDPGVPPARYFIAILKQLCGRYYSLIGATVAYIRPSNKASTTLRKKAKGAFPTLDDEAIDALALTWIADTADKFAVNRELSDSIRTGAAGFWTPTGATGRFDRTLQAKFATILGLSSDDIGALGVILRDELALPSTTDASYYIDPQKLQIEVAIDSLWYQCAHCMTLRPFVLHGHCTSCGSAEVHALTPNGSDYIRARKGFWRDPVSAALTGQSTLRGISVEEHTAQLSNRDNSKVHATTEEFELRFRDIKLEDRDRPIDVLSCTTTMEVGVDIGSLVAVGLRNVPPQRENYQQRAGRAGRRGASVSSVLTYAQSGPHDSFFFANPAQIVSGQPRNPDVKIDNPKIAKRHVHSYLLQTYFHGFMDEHGIAIGGATSALFRALGKASDFFSGDAGQVPTFDGFKAWCAKRVLSDDGEVGSAAERWLPPSLRIAPLTHRQWLMEVCNAFLAELTIIGGLVPKPPVIQKTDDDASDDDGSSDDTEERQPLEDRELLDLLFEKGLLPSYAFPTDLTSFLIEKLKRNPNNNRREMEIVERPQQSVQKALSEYAPGRLIVVNKQTYRSGGVVANVLPSVHDRAAPLFSDVMMLVHCDNCSFVNDIGHQCAEGDLCPVCDEPLKSNRLVVPQVFTPEDAWPLNEDDRDQDITYATAAQFPVPVDGAEPAGLSSIGERAAFTVASDQRLVITNRGEMVNEAFNGFYICEKCGKASTEDVTPGPHRRPYFIEPSFSQPKHSESCNGEFKNVFLGHVFSTDLLLVRIDLQAPIDTNTKHVVSLRALEDALHSVSEAFRLSASRHPQLDLDPSEFGSGFRIVPTADESRVHADIYLYDTLSGGAGYSELAGRYLREILASTLEMLEHCPGHCTASCQSCLRHYHNQHITGRLDRNLGASILRYALFGTVPGEKSILEQVRLLSPLKRLLELDGCVCSTAETIDGVPVPLVVRRDGKEVLVFTRPGLVATNAHSLAATSKKRAVEVLNEYVLRQNLPDEHQLVRGHL
jgi:ATP-dependent helicase YprA (DUF1998 family)